MARLASRQAPVDPEMARASEVLDVLAELWRDLSPALPPGVPAVEAAEVRLEGGVPALAGEPLIGGPALVAGVREIGRRLRAIEGYATAGEVSDALARHSSTFDTELFAATALGGMWDQIASLADGLELDAHALITLADYAARPALRAGALVVKPLVTASRWGRGTCPSCGAPPALSVRSGKEGDRSLFCPRCGTGWRYPRVRCPACGEDDHRRLGALHASGEGDFRRADVCDTCRSYVKSVAALDPPDADGVLRLDLDTAALDFAAIELGYHREGVPDDRGGPRETGPAEHRR